MYKVELSRIVLFLCVWMISTSVLSAGTPETPQALDYDTTPEQQAAEEWDAFLLSEDGQEYKRNYESGLWSEEKILNIASDMGKGYTYEEAVQRRSRMGYVHRGWDVIKATPGKMQRLSRDPFRRPMETVLYSLFCVVCLPLVVYYVISRIYRLTKHK